MKLAIAFALFLAVALESSANGSSKFFMQILSLHKGNNNNQGPTENAAVDPNFGTAFLDFIMAYKNIMPCGFAPWHLRPSAPLTLDTWKFNFNNNFSSASGIVNNLVITGLNDFRIIQFDYNENTGKTIFDIIYYDVQILGEYTMEAWAMVAGYNASVVGNGPMNWQIKDLRAFGALTMGSNDGYGSIISDFYMNFLVGDFINGSWNYKWDIAFNNYFNRFLREFIIMWTQQNQALLNNFYNDYLLPKENQLLKNINMSQIIAFLNQQTQLMKKANCHTTQN